MELITSSLLSHEVSLFESGVNLPCVGTIISSYLILTLASCLHENGKGQNKLTIKTKSGRGENSVSKWEEEEQTRRIGHIIFHAEFKNSSLENDLAILVLDKKLDSTRIKILPILSIFNKTSIHSYGVLCEEDSTFSSLEISDSSSVGFECPSSSESKSDKLCFFPAKSHDKSSSCSSPFPGSSLICSDEKRGHFLCGILANSPENTRENLKIYINITHHLKWIQSVSFEMKAKEFEVSSKSKKQKRETENPELSDEFNDDYEYEEVANVPDFEEDTKNDEEENPRIGLAIFGGVAVDPRDPISYQLSLQFQKENGSWQHRCGAVILDEATAVTAAHCFVESSDVRRYRVVAGENLLDKIDEQEQILPLKKLLIHPDYTIWTRGNDIAILHVDKIRFNKFARPVSISHFSHAQLTNLSAVISGWGQISNKAVVSNSLQKGNVQILPPEICAKRLKRQRFSAQGIICALNPSIRGCRGDSGGPLVIPKYKMGNSTEDLLVGVLSFGAHDCEMNHTAGFFTEMSHFYDWIQENRATPFGCGGFIKLEREHELIYQVPSDSEERQQNSVCLWIVSTGRKDANSSIEATILNNSSAQFNSDSDVIFAQHSFSTDQSHYETLNQVETKYGIPGPFLTVYYRTNSSAPTAGFHLKLKDSTPASELTERLDVKFIPLPNAELGNSREFSYPISISGILKNWSNEHTFFILKPQNLGAKIRVDLIAEESEAKNDWIEIYTYGNHPLNLLRLERGARGSLDVEGLENEPLLFYFHSNGSREEGGFKMEYSEMMPPNPILYLLAGCFALGFLVFVFLCYRLCKSFSAYSPVNSGD